MQLPRALCGTAKAVASTYRRRVTAFAKGGPWLDDDALIDAAAAPGLIALNGPAPLLADEDHVHAYAPFWELGRALDGGKLTLDGAARAFDEALTAPWALLGLLSQVNYRWFHDAGRAGRFLDAMIAAWPALDGVGPRYTMGSREGQRLWALPHLLKFVLAQRGVASAQLTAPLPAGGLAALIA